MLKYSKLTVCPLTLEELSNYFFVSTPLITFFRHSICNMNDDHKKEVMLASYSMLRGFLNALDAHDKTCSNFFICQAAQESSKAGQFGQLLAKVASSNAESWLTSINATLHMGTMNAGLHGVNEIITEQGCELNFPCKNFQKTFKKPKLL